MHWLMPSSRSLTGWCSAAYAMTGNATSSIVLVKGELNQEELAGGDLLAGNDGAALRAALTRLGWPPEDVCCLAAVAGKGETGHAVADTGELLPSEVFREALEALDPEAVVLLDNAAAHAMREAYGDALAQVEQLTRPCSSRGSWPMCWVGACLRSTVLRRRSPLRARSSACGPILSSYHRLARLTRGGFASGGGCIWLVCTRSRRPSANS